MSSHSTGAGRDPCGEKGRPAQCMYFQSRVMNAKEHSFSANCKYGNTIRRSRMNQRGGEVCRQGREVIDGNSWPHNVSLEITSSKSQTRTTPVG